MRNVKKLGRACINFNCFILNHRELNPRFPYLFRFDISTYVKKTQLFNFILSFKDLKIFDTNDRLSKYIDKNFDDSILDTI